MKYLKVSKYVRTKRLLFFILGDTVTIGDVSFKLKTPKNPELVPQNYSKYLLSFWRTFKALLKKFLFTQSPPWLYWNYLRNMFWRSMQFGEGCFCLVHYFISGSAGCIGILTLNITYPIGQWNSKRIICVCLIFFVKKGSYPGITSKYNLKLYSH